LSCCYVFASIASSSSPSSLLPSHQTMCLTHSPYRKPHENPQRKTHEDPGTEQETGEGGGEWERWGDLQYKYVLGGWGRGYRVGRIPPMMLDLQRKSLTWAHERLCPGPQGPWHHPEAVEKVETFFGLIDCLVCLSHDLRWRWKWTLAFWIGSTGFTPLFDCALHPRRSSGMEGGDTVTNLGLGLATESS
jgi:hypothetical protein